MTDNDIYTITKRLAEVSITTGKNLKELYTHKLNLT